MRVSPRGPAVSFLFRIHQAKTAKELAEALLVRRDAGGAQGRDGGHAGAREGELREPLPDALSQSTEEFLKLAKMHLQSERQASANEVQARKELIHREPRKMAEQVDGVGRLMRELEKDRVEKFGES